MSEKYSDQDLIEEIEKDLAAIEQLEMSAKQVNTRLLGYRRLFVLTGDESRRIDQEELMAQFQKEFPDSVVAITYATVAARNEVGPKWGLELAEKAEELMPRAYSIKWKIIAKIVKQDSILDARLVQQIEDDIPKIDKIESGKDRFVLKSDAYQRLYDITRDPVYLGRARETLKECLGVYPDDQMVQLSCLSYLARIEDNPKEAAIYYRRSAELLGWESRLPSSYYMPVMRLEFFHPGTLTSEELTEFFQAWATDIDSLKMAIETRPESTRQNDWKSRLIETSAQHYLWKAEMELARDGDIDQATKWLQQAKSIREEAIEFHFNLYVDARLELRSGDIAWAHGDQQAARQHYQNAWGEVASTEKKWSMKNVEDYAGGGLKELNRLGYTIKARLQDR